MKKKNDCYKHSRITIYLEDLDNKSDEIPYQESLTLMLIKKKVKIIGTSKLLGASIFRFTFAY